MRRAAQGALFALVEFLGQLPAGGKVVEDGGQGPDIARVAHPAGHQVARQAFPPLQGLLGGVQVGGGQRVFL